MCPQNQLLQGTGVTGVSEGLDTDGRSGVVPAAGGGKCLAFSKPVHMMYVQFASTLQAGLAGE